MLRETAIWIGAGLRSFVARSFVARSFVARSFVALSASAVLDRDVSHKGPSASNAAVRNERFDRLEKALEQLSDEHRRVILLSRIDGLSMKEIAARMERSPDAVMKLLRRALKKLKETFGDTESLSLPARALRTEGEERDAR